MQLKHWQTLAFVTILETLKQMAAISAKSDSHDHIQVEKNLLGESEFFYLCNHLASLS